MEGGFRFTARKVFGSGAPGGDLLMTTGVYQDPVTGPTVYHFPLSLNAEGVRILEDGTVVGRNDKGDRFFIGLPDLFAVAAEGSGTTTGSSRKAGFLG